jgi:uncharacterized glyoxalase superfamily protein PhnB
MMKSSETVIVVDSVEEAIKFYTEKLGFDIIDLLVSEEGGQHLSLARLRKGKCFIKFRIPLVEEFAEFSFIKRCASRCVCVYSEMKKGLDKYYARCQKKGVKFACELKDCKEMGRHMFVVKDPFGMKLVFAEAVEGAAVAKGEGNFLGMTVNPVQAKDPQTLEQMINHLKDFGILRRSAKKFAKLKAKEIAK